MMINRAIKKRDELASFILKLEVESDASRRLPAADSLTTDDWKVLLEIREILRPIYQHTMRTQGKSNSLGHGQLWEVMTGMEYILEHLEDWKVQYDILDPDRIRHLSPSATVTQAGSQPGGDNTVPARSINEYISLINDLHDESRAHIRASINNAWVKLNSYYSKLAESPLFAASVILNPNLQLGWLEENWKDDSQLPWVRKAKSDLRDYFDRWYPSGQEQQPVQQQRRVPIPDDDFQDWLNRRQPTSRPEGELEGYYKLPKQQ
jgi:hypothetical protein